MYSILGVAQPASASPLDEGSETLYVTDRTGNGMKLWIQSLEDRNDEGHLLEPARANLAGL